MSQKSKQTSIRITSLFSVLITLMLFGSACSFASQSDLQGTQIALDIQSTRQVLKQTELAVESDNPPEEQDPPQSPSITPSETLTPTMTPETIINIDTATPTSTQTAVVQPPTITPTSTMENQAMPGVQVFGDDFSNSTSGWPIQDVGSYQLSYKDNHYHVRVRDPYVQVVSFYEYNISDGGIQTKVTIDQDQPQASYGLVWRYKDGDNYYYFEIDSNSNYVVGRWLNGVNNYLKQGTNNSAINSTGYNSIYAVFLQDELIFFVNGDLIDTVFDNALSDGYVGVSATTGEFGDFAVSFDQFEIAQ